MTKALLTSKDIKDFLMDIIIDWKQNNILDRNDMCKFFDISFYELNQYLEQGLPWCGTPTRKKFNINECRRWFYENKRK